MRGDESFFSAPAFSKHCWRSIGLVAFLRVRNQGEGVARASKLGFGDYYEGGAGGGPCTGGALYRVDMPRLGPGESRLGRYAVDGCEDYIANADRIVVVVKVDVEEAISETDETNNSLERDASRLTLRRETQYREGEWGTAARWSEPEE